MKRLEVIEKLASHESEISAMIEHLVPGANAEVYVGAGGGKYIIARIGDDKPGWRAKDDPELRRLIRNGVNSMLDDLGIDWRCRTVARYGCLTERPDGLLERHDPGGHVIGTHVR